MLAAALCLSVTGALLGAGVAWSDNGPTVVIPRVHRHSTGGATGQGQGSQQVQTTTTVTTTTTTTTTTSTSTSSARAATANGSKPGAATAKKPAKPKDKPKPKPPVTLTATLASTPQLPERELGLWTSVPRALSPSQVHVTENGAAVSGLALKPVTQAAEREFGVVVVLDESSGLSQETRALEFAAVQAIAAKRTGQQEFGVITFAGTPSLMVPVTSDTQVINAALGTQPLVAPGSSVLPALSAGYAALQRAGVATGAVILVTAGQNLADPAAEAAVAQGGLKLGYQTFTTDVLTAPVLSGGSTQPKGGDNDEEQERALGANLRSAADIWTRLNSGYLVSYRSAASAGQNVNVSVAVDGVSGSLTAQYVASRRVAAPVAGPLTPGSYPLLSAHPSFAAATTVFAPPAQTRANPSFWSSPVSLVLVSLVCALLFSGSLWLLVGGVGRSELETRVASFIPGEREAEDPTELALASAPGVPPLLARRRWWPGFVLKAEVSQFKRPPVSLVKLAVAGSLVASALLVLLLGSLGAVLLGLPVGPLVLYFALRRAVRKARTKFADQLPSSLQDMAGAVRGGRSLAGAMVAVTDGADQPILGEFERAVADEQLGRPLEVSLHTMAERMTSEDMQQVALVATLHRRSGSSVAEALDHVAEGARERAELVRELKSLTGQARLSSRILTGLPVALFLALNVLEPKYMHPLLHTVAGIFVLVVCGLMVTTGWFAMKRIVKVEA